MQYLVELLLILNCFRIKMVIEVRRIALNN